MLEKQVEARLKKRLGLEVPRAKCWKMVCPGISGVPDRLILLPGGQIVFVELKQPGKHERARQDYIHAVLRGMGFTVYSTVDSYARVEEVVADIKRKAEMQDGV